VVKIDATGMGIGRKPGHARITATFAFTDAKGVQAYKQVSTNASVPSLKAIAVEPPGASLRIGEELRFKAIGTYTDRSRKEAGGVLWRSSNLAVLTFDKSGVGTGRSEGDATVTVLLESNPAVLATAKVGVRAAPLREVTIEMMNAGAFDGRLQRGRRLQLRAMGHAPVGSGKVTSRHLADAEWSSQDDKVAQVKDGIVRAVKVGDTVISAKDRESGITARIPLHVIEESAAGSGLPANFDKLPAALSAPYRDAKKRYDELHAELRTLDNVPHLMASMKSIVADIGRAGPGAVDQAEKLETQSQLFEHIRSQVKVFENHIESAAAHLDRADAALAVHAGRVEVADLRRKAKEQGKNIKLVMGLAKGLWKATHHDYVGGALELVSGVLDKFHTSDFDKAADELERSLDAKTRKLLQADLDAVKRELALAKEASAEAKKQAAHADRFFGNLREKAEESFDAGAKKGSFRFADLTTALAIADRVVDVLIPPLKQAAATAIAGVGRRCRMRRAAARRACCCAR